MGSFAWWSSRKGWKMLPYIPVADARSNDILTTPDPPRAITLLFHDSAKAQYSWEAGEFAHDGQISILMTQRIQRSCSVVIGISRQGAVRPVVVTILVLIDAVQVMRRMMTVSIDDLDDEKVRQCISMFSVRPRRIASASGSHSKSDRCCAVSCVS